MKKLIILWIFTLLLIVSSVSAYTIGFNATQIVTGNNVDDFNITNYNKAYFDIREYIQKYNFDVSGKGVLSGFFIGDNGSKMYLQSWDTDLVYQYNLSIPYNVSSATYYTSFSTIGQDTSPTSVVFNNNGSKMYLMGNANDRVYTYVLSTPWKLNTASYSSYLSLGSGDYEAIRFNTDGTKFYVSNDDTIKQYNLSSAFNLATVGTATNFDTDEHIYEFEFNNDGTKLITSLNSYFKQYNLSIPWNIQTTSIFYTRGTGMGGDVGIYSIKDEENKLLLSSRTATDVYNFDLIETKLINNSQTLDTTNLYNGTFTFSKSGYYNMTQTETINESKTITFEDVYDSLINISRYLLPTNTTLNNFTGWIYNLDNDVNVSYSSTTYYDLVPLAQGLNYTITMNPYLNYSGNSTTYYVDGFTEAYKFYSYEFGNLYVSFKYEINNTLMSGVTVDVQISADGYYLNTNTTNGSLIVSDLIPNDYIIRYSADGYEERVYYFTLEDSDYSILTLYLALNSTLTEIEFFVKDYVDSVIEDAQVKALKFDTTTGNYVLVEQCNTNYLGVCYMNLLYNQEFYKFQVQYNDETKLTTNPSYINAYSYVFRISTEQDYSEDIFNFADIDASLSFNTNTSNFRLTYNDVNSIATNFCLYVYSFDNGEFSLEDSECLQTASGTILIPITVVNGTLYTAYAYYNTPQEFLMSLSYEAPNQPVDKNLGFFLQFLLSLTFVFLVIKFPEFIGVSFGFSLVLGKLILLHSISWGIVWGVIITGVILIFILKGDR